MSTKTHRALAPAPFPTTAALDEILLDVATLIELSPRDRRVAEARYRRLKTHLERQGSALAPYMVDGASMIYAQGSVATSTTIVSGIEDDRFDVDAIVEIDVPPHWRPSQPLDVLEEALQSFPGVERIERCTRCVQLQFPFMHMDVTLLDGIHRHLVARAGDIFHSPDKGDAYRVPSNPWGFTAWFRAAVGAQQTDFAKAVSGRRAALSMSRLRTLDAVEEAFAKADQQDLPPIIPSALDAQEAVALKLLKRFLNRRYETLPLKRPPSIYLTKRSGMVGYHPAGLSFQLVVLAHTTAQIMRTHLAQGTRPAEVNPTYLADKINDRWPAAGPEGRRDMQALAEALEYLVERLEHMAMAPLKEIAKGIDDLFGECVGAAQRGVLATRYDRRDPSAAANLIQPRTGTIRTPSIITSAAGMREVPRHNFHPFILYTDYDD